MKTLLILALSLSVTPSKPQRAEMIFGKECGVAMEPGPGFLLHVPTLNDGNPDIAHMYVTGQVIFSVALPKCGLWTVTR